ncbi:hypothetical protein PUW24_22190 [Paenibacillus urinalis]|uniref:Uncharacterized protein n=1 Tax=Paenibacillus urinalis TaxID=521520 RepID=A0AAX3MWF5_9BACL|nr:MULTISPECIES: hypothetical protein [Paenibacillus]WDH80775.1 hypothetical protein PUW23_14600 [Paenibacillus urinalis]WDH96827.1 hypothetical protein PUW24_22190 [Paenibacillus urinalis]WDI00470.1 hypothetical protein PUW25_14340 [Paenibacillus urinalis]
MNKNEGSDKFSKFVLWVIISTITEIITLYVLSSMNPHDDGFNAYFRSVSGFFSFFIGLIIPLTIIIFLFFFVMLLLHDRLRGLTQLSKIVYYLFICVLSGILLHFVFNPDWYMLYFSSFIPPVLFGIVLEKGWLRQT